MTQCEERRRDDVRTALGISGINLRRKRNDEAKRVVTGIGNTSETAKKRKGTAVSSNL